MLAHVFPVDNISHMEMTVFCAPVNSENFKIMQKMSTVSRFMESCVSIFQPISIRPAAICVPVHRI
jgi:hypothetical protein